MQHLFKTFSSAAMAATLCAGMISCDKETEPQIIEKEKAAIELTDKSQSAIILEAGSTESFNIEFTTDFKLEDLTIETKSGADWCTAEFAGKNAIKITPMEKNMLEMKTAEFIVKEAPEAKSAEPVIVYRPKAVSISIARKASKIEKVSAILLNDPENKKIEVPIGSTEPVEISFSSKFDTNELTINTKNGADWCTAEFVGNNKIKFTPSQEFRTDFKSAEFEIARVETKGQAVYYEAIPVTIYVNRDKVNVMPQKVITITGYIQDNFGLRPGSTDPYTINAACNFPIESLTIKEKDGKTWCTAELTDAGIVITPTEEGMEQDMSATFVIEGNQNKDLGTVIYSPEAVQFKITRGKYIKEFTITLEGKGIKLLNENTYKVDLMGGKQILEVKVMTQAATWYFNRGYVAEWIKATPDHGDPGQICTLEIEANPDSNYRYGDVLFTTLPGAYEGTTLYIEQANQF